MWWVYFRRGGELVGAAIIEAPSPYHARTRVDFEELAGPQIIAKRSQSKPNKRS